MFAKCPLLVAFILICTSIVATAQAPDAKPAGVADVPSPKAFFGYELGQKFTTHARCVRYVDKLAATSARISVMRRGETFEGRELVLAFATSEENQARLEALREKMARWADPRQALGEGETTASMSEDLPAFVWLSYCVHGNESSCTEAALKVLHELATSNSEEVQTMLENTVVIIDPCSNPDGRDRYVNWFNSIVGKKADPHPQSMEHQEPWPAGRFNHYCFDLNRDWAFVSQRETRSRAREYIRWNPQVHVDFHEMGYESTYFFFPAAKPVNTNLPPYTVEWGEIFGRGNAAAFDRRGWDYYTAESFDLFYPGYGDSWPSFHGAIGMTYEQAGHGRSGAAVKKRSGEILTLQDRVDHHVVASFATINTAATNRAKLLNDFRRFRESAIAEGKGGPIREFILVPGDDLERCRRLVESLELQGIEVRRAEKEFSTRDVVDYGGKRHEEKKFNSGVYLVSLAQPTKRLIKTLLEPKTEIRELYFYDVAAWSLPLCFGVEAYWSPTDIEVETSPAGAEAAPVGKIEEGDATYGYLLRWDTQASVRAALALIEKGVAVRSAQKAFTLNKRAWKRGTIFVPRGRNHKDLDTIVKDVATETGATFVPTTTGMTEKGVDLGSSNVRVLRKPKIALLGGSSVSSSSFGAARFLIEELYGIPYSVFDFEQLARLDLEDFTALVIPSAFGSIGEAARKKLSEFCSEGGVVITWGGAARSLGKEGSKWSSISTKSPEAKPTKPVARPKLIEDREEQRRKKSTPGSIFRVELDPAHPISFGYGSEIAVFKSGTSTFDPEGGGVAVGRFRDAEPIAGYILPESEKKMRGRGYVMVERKGRGAVVFFADDPNFRSAWHGLTRLFLNAALLLPRN